MGSGNYESQILEAIQILVDNAVSKANYDKTIQGTISRCVDATIGKYIVKYQDSSFYAYSHNTETTYPAGTSVYVLVPGNDMSKDKSIIGTVDHLGPDYVSIIEGENGYEVTGVNTINADGTFGLCSYKNEDIKILYDRDNSVDLIGLDVFGFENYIKKSNSIICGATFKTALDSAQKYRGDYGIVFHLDFTDKSTGEVVTKSYIVNVDQMTGNPYSYTVASRQYGIFDVDGANFISVKQIYLFAYDFPNVAEGKENDIFVSKVELSAANALDKEAAATCALTFVTPQGTYFDETHLETDTKTLQAQIRIKGNAIDNDSQNVDYYWFRENNNITAKSEKYNQYGGAGWECLNNYSVVQNQTEDNEAVVQWARGNYQYMTKKADNVARETTYKCVAVYFDGTILSKTIVIYNYSSNYEISIQSDSGVAFNYDLGKPTLTCYVNGQEETSDAYSYVWSVINSSNQFSVLSETTTDNEKYANAIQQRDAILAKISAEQLLTAADSENLSLYNQTIDQYEYIMRVEDNKIHNLKISSITKFSTYKCSVYKSGVFIGTASIIITNTEEANPNYTLIIDNGNQIFKYNEKGISPANGSNQTPQTIEPISFTLYDEKGQKINHNVIKNIEWRVPNNDTLLDVSLVHGNGNKNEDGTKSYFDDPELNISIAPNYNAHYDKNEIQLIITYNDKVISAKTNFTFVKEGETGTNGTDFVCKIVPNTSDSIVPKYPVVTYNEYLQQYQLNYTPNNTNTWFTVQLWHDGELIFNNYQTGNTLENKEAKVQWMMLQNTYKKDDITNEIIKDDSNFVINKDTGAISFNPIEYVNPANIVKVIVNYNNVDYYATLPITIARVESDDYDIQLLDTSGFRHVMYTTDGQSPAYDNQPFELIISQIVEGVKNDISQFSSSNFAVDYDWKVKGSVYYSDWQSELNLIENTLYKTKEQRNQKYFKPVDTYNGLCVTNALVCNITRGEEKEKIASIHIPIHFYINRYGNAAINGWDGNSISLDENGTTILAPQVGAGKKNDDNTFTGVFMGSVKEPGAEKEEHGLFGYNAGQRTITLNSEDGSARFGKEGLGQIVIDPTTNEAIIRSGKYDTKTGIGMEINLTEPSIKFASGKFEVDKEGNVTADSFATRSSVEKLEEQTEEIEQTITYFDVSPQTNFVVVASDVNHFPLETKDYTINTYPLFKGQLITTGVTAKIKGTKPQGFNVTVDGNSIIFKVTSNQQITANTTDVTILYEYTSSAGVDYDIEKVYSLSLAVQGKDGYQGSDGKSAYQVWLEAGNTGTEEDYLNSLKGADGEPGKDGAKGEDGEAGKSAYQIWLEAGNTGTEEEYLASLKGADGAQGEPGKDGEKGDTGIGVSKIVEQYYLSTSNQKQENGDWKEAQDPWTSGKYIWTRSEITWTDGTKTHTDPVLADALNKANTTANTANTNASNAVNTANTASSTANTANQTANQANQTAANADKTAGEAKQEAATATQTANSATNTANDALDKANTANQGLSALDAVVKANYKDLQGQIDGAIATWFYNYEPNTPNTLPTSEWTTETLKEQHLGDLFYIIDNEEKAGQCFRYAKIDNVYKWVIVEDVEVAKAIADAATAQATADGKATIYTGATTPTNPQSGDLWMKSQDDGILTYVKQTDGTFAWVEYNKYTDDALATEAKNTADTAKNTADSAKQTADSASQTATNAHNEVQNTVKQVDVEYYVASSETEVPTDSSDWDTNAPQWSAGKFIWSRQKMTFVDASKPAQYSEPARVTGATGKAGQDGLSAYQIAVAGGFKGTETEWLASLVGKDGEDGKDGAQGIQGPAGADGKTSYLHIAYANSSDGATDFSTTVSTNKLYIGQYTDFTEADSTTPSKYHWTLIKGADGEDGKDGENGVGVKSVTNKYALTTNTTAPAKTSSSWKDTPQTITSTNKYLWNYEIITYTNNTTTETDARIIGAYGDPGKNGSNGSNGTDGKGIVSIEEHFQVGTSNTTAPAETTIWPTTPQTMTSTNKYLWSYEIITYTTGDPTTTTKRVIGTYGEKGNDGKGIKSTTIDYQVSTNGQTIPTGTWLPQSQMPLAEPGQYLWTRTIITYTSGDPSTSYSVSKAGSTGAKGDKGEAGKDGTDGKSVTVTSSVTKYVTSSSGTTIPSSGWSTTIPATTTTNKYLWTQVITTFSDGKTAESYSVSSTMDSINMGGRNYLCNSAFLQGLEGWSVSTNAGTNVAVDTEVLFGDHPTLHILSEGQTASVWRGATSYRLPKSGTTFKAGETWTISAWVMAKDISKIDSNLGLEIKGNKEGETNSVAIGSRYLSPSNMTNGVWKKMSATFTPDTDIQNCYIYMYVTKNGEVWFANPKVEKGNVATDWTPAPEDTENQIASLKESISEIVVGTQTASTNKFTGVASFSTLKHGQQISYWLPYAGTSTAATLNLTLADGTTTGAKNVYYQGTTRLTTHYPAGAIIHLTYRENITIGTSTTKYTGWWGDANYVDGNNYDRLKWVSTITASSAITAKTMIAGTASGYKHIAANTAFDINKPILYAVSAIAAAATGTNNYIAYPDINLTTTKSGFTGTNGKTCYIVGTLDGTTFTPSSEVFTTVEPTTNDGMTYISLGLMRSATNINLYPEHPLYKFVNGKFQSLSQVAFEAQDNLDHLEVGGRNFILNSSFEYGLNNWTSTSGTSFVLAQDEGYRGGNAGRAVMSASTVCPRQTRPDLIIKAGETLVATAKVKLEEGELGNLSFRFASSHTLPRISEKTLQDGWMLLTFKDTMTADKDFSNVVYGLYNSTATMLIDELKLEKGTIATDWTPAPEDTQTNIDNAIATTVKSTTMYYAVTTTKAEMPNANADDIWVTSVADLGQTANKYIWSKIRTTYGDNSYKDSIPTFLYQDVKTLEKIVLWYATSDDYLIAPTDGWSTDPPGDTNAYIWTKTVNYYTDNTNNFNEAIAVCDTTITKLQNGIDEKGRQVFESLQDKGFVRIYEDRIFLLDNKKETEVKQAICMNNNGIAFAKAEEGKFLTWDSEKQTFTESFTSVWGIEGTFDLLGLNVLNIKAENIQDGTLTLGKDTNQKGHLEIYGVNESTPTVMANGDGIIITLNNGGEIRLSESEGLIVTHGNASNKEFGSYQNGKGFESKNLRAVEELDFGSSMAAKPMSITTADGVTHIGVGFIKIIS